MIYGIVVAPLVMCLAQLCGRGLFVMATVIIVAMMIVCVVISVVAIMSVMMRSIIPFARVVAVVRVLVGLLLPHELLVKVPFVCVLSHNLLESAVGVVFFPKGEISELGLAMGSFYLIHRSVEYPNVIRWLEVPQLSVLLGVE